MKALRVTSSGSFRVVDIPGLGSYDLISGHGRAPGDFARSSWAYACVLIRSAEVSQIPWRLTRRGKVVEEHPILDTLRGVDFAALEADLLLKGAAFLARERDALLRLNPGTVSVETSARGITGFVQTIDGRAQPPWARDEVVYFREFHPTDDLGPGVAAMDVARIPARTEYESSRYVKDFFENDAVPGLLMHTEKDVGRPILETLKAWWDERFRGRGKHHKTAWLDKGFDATILTTSLGDMALKVVRDEARRDICTAFRVPMELVGALSASNYATAREARRLLVQDVTIPRVRYVADVLNRDWVALVDPGVRLEPATDTLPILQEDLDAKAERLGKLLDRSVIGPEFVRAEMGYPETAAPRLNAPESVRAAWHRKALKAFRAGRAPDVPFETEDILPAQQAAIRARLAGAGSEDEVRRAFLDG